MKYLALAAAAALVLTAVSPAIATTLTVPGTANPWLAGMTNGFAESAGDSTPANSPVLFTGFTAGVALRFNASGSAGYTAGAESGPAGVDGYPVTHGAELGIGEIDGANANALIGVFLTDAMPDPTAAVPTPYNFTTAASRDYLQLAPELNQPFSIGTGLTTNGTAQTILVPTGATRLYLGIMDGSGWYDNTGSFAVDVTTVTVLPEITSFTYSAGAPPIHPTNHWQFLASYATTISELRLRVQTTLTPTNSDSWVNLDGNALMTPVAANWSLDTANIPAGTHYFRVLATAPGYVDRASTTIGPITVIGPVDLVAGLVGYYPFDNSGTDASGRGHDVAPTAAAFSSDRFGNSAAAFDLQGADDGNWGEVDDNTDFQFGKGDFSFSVWLRYGPQSNNGSGYSVVLIKARQDGGWDGPTLFVDYPAPGSVSYRTTAGDLTAGNATGLNDNAWRHFIFLRSGSTLRLYINGILDSSADWPVVDVSNSEPLWLGCNQVNRAIQNYDGLMDELRIYNRALSADEAAAIYATDAAPVTGIQPLDNFAWKSTLPFRNGVPWTFTVTEKAALPGLSLNVQSSPTPDQPGSWTALPHGGQMTQSGEGTWALTTTEVPLGTNSFRVVASAPSYDSRSSLLAGPFAIVKGLPNVTAYSYSTGGTPIRSNNHWTFTATYATTVSDLRLAVQSTLNKDDDASWQTLPANPFMTHIDANWTLNSTDVPAGLRYFRIVSVAPGYVGGSSDAFGPINVLDGIGPFGTLVWDTTFPNQTGVPWTFTIEQKSLVSDLRLRVQSSTTPDDEGSWNDLPGTSQMSHLDSTWRLITSTVPAGVRFFRVVALASTYTDRVSTIQGPFTIRSPLAVSSQKASQSGRHVLSLQDPTDPSVVFAIAVSRAFIEFDIPFIPGFDLVKYNQAVTLAAEQYASAEMRILANQQVGLVGFTVGPNARLELKGKAVGDVSLVNAASIVAQGGGNIVAQGGGNLSYDLSTGAYIVAQGGGNIVAQGGGNIVAQGGGNIVAQGGGNIVAQGGGNIVAQGGGNIVAQGGGNVTGAGPTSYDGRLGTTPSRGLKTRVLQNGLPVQSGFTGIMSIDGNYNQLDGILTIGIAGTNTLSTGAQQYDQLVVSGRANSLGGAIAFGLFDPNNWTNRVGAFLPSEGATFDVIVASNIVLNAVSLAGPIWGDGQFFTGNVVTLQDGRQAVRLTATHVPPRLQMRSAGTSLSLSYPTNYTGFVIEGTPALAQPQWSVLSSSNSIEIGATNRSAFYRLRGPAPAQ